MSLMVGESLEWGGGWGWGWLRWGWGWGWGRGATWGNFFENRQKNQEAAGNMKTRKDTKRESVESGRSKTNLRNILGFGNFMERSFSCNLKKVTSGF